MAAAQVPWIVDGEAGNAAITKRPLKYILTASGMDVDNLGFIGFMPVFNVKAFLAVGDGVSDDTIPVRNAVIAAQLVAGGARVFFPTGNFLLTGTVPVTGHRMHIQGSGKYATTITFNPAAAAAAFKFQRTITSEVQYQCSFGLLSFVGAGTQQKIALDLYDISEMDIGFITASSWTGNSGSGATPSIGVRIAGRELLSVHDIDLFADRPIHVMRNVNAPTLSCDHFHFGNCYLSPLVTTEASYLFDGDIGIASLVIDGYQSWIGGKYGVLGSAGSPPATALDVKILTGRYEQPGVNTGHAIRWEIATTGFICGANLGGVGSPTNGGLYLRNVSRITLLNLIYTGQGEALNIDSTCNDLMLQSVFIQDSATVTLTGLEEVWSMPKTSGLAPIAPTGYWYRTAAGARQMSIFGVPKSRLTQTLASGATYNLRMSASGALKTGKVTVSAYSATGPTREMGMWHVDGTGAVLVVGTANTAAGNVALKLCILWNSIGSIQVLNNLAQLVTIVVEEDWTT